MSSRIASFRVNGKITRTNNEENAGADFLPRSFFSVDLMEKGERESERTCVQARDYLRNSPGEQESRYGVSRATLRYSRAPDSRSRIFVRLSLNYSPLTSHPASPPSTLPGAVQSARNVHKK